MKETAWNRPNLQHIWTYRQQRHSAATNVASTDCNLPPQGWSEQSNWTAHRKLCPRKVPYGWLGWALAGASRYHLHQMMATWTCQHGNIPARFPFLAFQTAAFPGSAISLVPLYLKISWLGSPMLPFPVYGHRQTLTFYRGTECFLIHSPVSQIQHWLARGHTVEAQLFQSAHSG